MRSRRKLLAPGLCALVVVACAVGCSAAAPTVTGAGRADGGSTDPVAPNCADEYSAWVDGRAPAHQKGTLLSSRPLTDANAGGFPFAAVALAGVEVTCATAYLIDDADPAGRDEVLGVLVWAADATELQFDEVSHLAVALGYVLTSDDAPVETAGGADEESATDAAAGGEEVVQYYRRFDAPEAGAPEARALEPGATARPAGAQPAPGSSVQLEFYPNASESAASGLAITFVPAPS